MFQQIEAFEMTLPKLLLVTGHLPACNIWHRSAYFDPFFEVNRLD